MGSRGPSKPKMFGASSQTDAAFVANVVIVVVADVVVDNFDRCVGRKTIDDSAMIRHYFNNMIINMAMDIYQLIFSIH